MHLRRIEMRAYARGDGPWTSRRSVSFGREPDGKVAVAPDPTLATAPFFVDDCHSWRADGPVVAQFFPQFSRRR